MKKTITILLLLTLILAPLNTLNVEGINRYTELSYEPQHYVFIHRSMNTTHPWNMCLDRLNLNTGEIIEIECTTGSSSNPKYSTSTFYQDRNFIGYTNQFNHNTLNPTSLGTFINPSHYMDGRGYNPTLSNTYNPISRVYHIGGRTGSQSITDRQIFHQMITNQVLFNINQTGVNRVNHAYSDVLGTTLQYGAGMSAPSKYYDILYNSMTGTPPPIYREIRTDYDTSTAIEKYAVGGTTPRYAYYSAGITTNLNLIYQHDLLAGLNLSRTITLNTDHRISSLAILHNSGHRLLVTGHQWVDGNKTAYFLIYDRLGQIINGLSWFQNTTLTYGTELSDGTIALIHQDIDTDRYTIQFRHPYTLNHVYSQVSYDDGIKIHGLTDRRFNDYGYRSDLLSPLYSMESRSNKLSDIDVVPEDVYKFLYDGTIQEGYEYNIIDLTNKKVSVTITGLGDVDNLPLNFLVSNGRHDTTGIWGYHTLTDMTYHSSYNTGLIGGATGDTLYTNFSSVLQNNRLYVLDQNITLSRLSGSLGYATLGLYENQNEGMSGSIAVIGSHRTTQSDDALIGNYTTFRTNSLLKAELMSNSPTLNEDDFLYYNIKTYLDTGHKRYSHKVTAYYDNQAPIELGFTYWKTYTANTLRGFELSVWDNHETQVIMDVYSTGTLPSMIGRSASSDFDGARILPTQILREGNNQIYVSYSPTSSVNYADNILWEYEVIMIDGSILGVPSTILPQPPPGSQVPSDYQIFSGIIPNFMGTPQNTTMFIALVLMVLVLIIGAIIGAGSGMIVLGFFVGLGFVFMLAIYFALIGWLPAWIPVIAFVMTALIGANSIRNAFTGTGGS